MAEMASFVCRVLNSRWPVWAASKEMVAVSLSRISHHAEIAVPGGSLLHRKNREEKISVETLHKIPFVDNWESQ